MPTRILVAAHVAALLLAMSACSRQAPSPPAQTATGVSAPATAPVAAGAAAPWAGHVLRGGDPASIRQYLQTVREIKPIRFNVKWNPATVAIDKEAALRSLRSVSRDGATFVFASREPAVARLKPGSILWVWDIAVRKVDSVTAAGALIRVHTVPVALTEAIPDADIEFDARAPLNDFLLSPRTAGSNAPRTAHIRPRTQWRDLRPVLYRDSGDDKPSGPSDGASPEPQSSPDENADGEADDEQEDHFEGNTYRGTLKGYEFSIGYRPTGADGLRFLLEARKAEESEGEGESEPPESEGVKEKHEELEKQEKEVDHEIKKLRQEDFEQEEGVKQLDEDYEKQLARMHQDDSNRNNPSYTGPSPPPRPTDSNGSPLTEQAAEAQLKAQYEKQRSLEMQKLQQVRQILADAEIKKSDLRHQLKELGKAFGKHALKELYEIASENLDVRFKADADLSGFDVAGLYQFAGGDIQKAQMQLKNLNGSVKTDFIARLGKPGNQGSKIPVIEIPIVFDLPMPIGGIPFVCQIGTDFLINVQLTGLHATLNLSGRFNYNGTDGFSYSKSQSSYDSTLAAASKPAISLSRGASPGVSAVVLGIQIPRWGFGLGVWGVSSLAYFDIVHVFTMTKSADVAMGLGAPPCLRTTYAASGDVGIETQALPIPIESIQKLAANQLTKKKQIFNVQSEKLDPPVKACEIGG